jgi:hypothetical protein
MDRQARTGDTLLVKVREITGRSQTMLGGGGGQKTKFIGHVCRFRKDDFATVSQFSTLADGIVGVGKDSAYWRMAINKTVPCSHGPNIYKDTN